MNRPTQRTTHPPLPLDTHRDLIPKPDGTGWIVANRPDQHHPAPAPYLPPHQPIDISPALTAQTGPQERTTATDRAYGLLIRTAAFSAIWAILSIGVVILAANWPPAAQILPTPWLAIILWGGLTACSFFALDHSEHNHSAGGIERLRITESVDLAKHDLNLKHQRDMAAIQLYLDRTLNDPD